jgi:hypothetical protein
VNSPVQGAIMQQRPFGFSMRSISSAVSQKNSVCLNVWPEISTSMLLDLSSLQLYGSWMTKSTFRPGARSAPTYRYGTRSNIGRQLPRISGFRDQEWSAALMRSRPGVSAGTPSFYRWSSNARRLSQSYRVIVPQARWQSRGHFRAEACFWGLGALPFRFTL